MEPVVNLSNLNRVQSSKVKHSLNQQEEVSIIDQLTRDRTTTTVQQATNMTNDTKVINTKGERH